MGSLLYAKDIPVTDKISVHVPTVGEVVDNEDDYYGIVAMLTAVPYDMMGQLDDLGIDFTEIDEFQLFIILMASLREMDTHLVLGDIDLKKFRLMINEDTQMPTLVDTENDIVIDKVVHSKIADALRQIHNLEKTRKKPGNDEAKAYLIKQAKKKARRKRKRKSQLDALIISLVNTEQFKYDYESVRDITIYQFNQSVRQIGHKIDFDNLMRGVYAGTVDTKKISSDKLTWLTTGAAQ